MSLYFTINITEKLINGEKYMSLMMFHSKGDNELTVNIRTQNILIYISSVFFFNFYYQ